MIMISSGSSFIFFGTGWCRGVACRFGILMSASENEKYMMKNFYLIIFSNYENYIYY